MLRHLLATSIIASATAIGASAGPIAASPPFPDSIVLTSAATEATGFRAEGVVASGRTAYAGSLATGTIVEVDLITGAVSTLVASAGGPAVGLALDGGRLYVAGGPSGELRIYDTSDGSLVDLVQLAPPGAGFINDVVVASDAAYATDSFNAVLHRIPLGGGAPEALTLTGDFVLAPGFNSNGIVDAGGGRLVLAQSSDPTDGVGSALYAVDVTGAEALADRIELRGDVANADGLLLRGRRLYVVQNALDSIAEVRLSGDLRRGSVVGVRTDRDFAVPTTVTYALGALYAVNARFGAPDPTAVEYEIVRVDMG
jgi:hypothetical protein